MAAIVPAGYGNLPTVGRRRVLEPAGDGLPADGPLEVEVEVVLIARSPIEAPAHPFAVSQEPLDRGARYADHRDVARPEVRNDPVETVSDRGAHRAAGVVVRPEHETVDHK